MDIGAEVSKIGELIKEYEAHENRHAAGIKEATAEEAPSEDDLPKIQLF